MRYRCLALCSDGEQGILQKSVEQVARRSGDHALLEFFRRREDLLYRLRKGNYDGVVVSLPGALGMESVLGVREADKQVPLLWISEDEVFALESYRLGAEFLHGPPEASGQERITQALERCLARSGKEVTAKQAQAHWAVL